MNERQQKLLQAVVEEYIDTALPIGSALLASKYALDISPATVRNEMMELDTLGYLYQPYTSAGRIPTEKAYKMYVDGIDIPESRLGQKAEAFIEMTYKTNGSKKDERRMVKDVAKALAKESNEAIIIGFDKHDSYYTGISYLFAKPEFHNADFMHEISSVIDRLDEVVSDLWKDAVQSVRVFIGSDNNFSPNCTLMTAKCGESGDKLLGLIGPMRMNYKYNIALLRFTQMILL